MEETAVAVLGGGSWGTALAWLLCQAGHAARLWCRDPDQAAAIAAGGENVRYLPGVRLPPGLWVSPDLAGVLRDASLVVAAVPAQALRETARRVRPFLTPGAALAIAAKGLESGTGRRLSTVAAEELGEGAAGRLAVLSGPNLSGEVVRRIPTATVVAARDPVVAARLQAALGTAFFRVYSNPDVAGVELGGALKNPIAIAAGISDGLGFGNNTKASLLTRGLAEITRLGTAAGGAPATFAGLSGLGDLVATAYSPLSRNYRLGLAVGRGESPDAARASLGHVAEGMATAEAACLLSARLGVEVPILAEVRRILYEGKPAAEAVTGLMARPHREE